MRAEIDRLDFTVNNLTETISRIREQEREDHNELIVVMERLIASTEANRLELREIRELIPEPRAEAVGRGKFDRTSLHVSQFASFPNAGGGSDVGFHDLAGRFLRVASFSPGEAEKASDLLDKLNGTGVSPERLFGELREIRETISELTAPKARNTVEPRTPAERRMFEEGCNG